LTNFRRGAKLLALIVVAPAFSLLPGCTDLTESPQSSITPENFYKNQDEVMGGLASVYAQLRNIFPGTDGDPGYWALSEVSSDEAIVPTRGGDWADNGRWIELHNQTWTANSPAGLTFINNTWREAFKGVTRANVLLAALPSVAIANKAVIEAELRTLRALYYYKLMDLFGGVPLVTTTEIMPRAKATRKEVFDFIDAELNATRTVLPLTWPPDQNGRMTRGAADVILANMYLNAAVFAGTPSGTAYNSCTTVQIGGVNACQAAITVADRILNSGAYSLAADQRQNFAFDNHLSPEIILAAKFINDPDLGFHLIQTSLHYNQFSTSPWNGFSLVAAQYRAFDPNDIRRQAFLVGQQVHVESGLPVTERAPSTARLNFTIDIVNQQDARENEGVRFYKWPRDPAHAQQGNGNDFAYFRLAEVYIIKAEALNEITPGSPAALVLLNQVRARAFATPQPLPAITRDVILRERMFEFAYEGKRRQDLIRHGKFTAPWEFKTATTGAFRILFSIPQTQLDANPLLVQNPGY
jgi:hypothetical protein